MSALFSPCGKYRYLLERGDQTRPVCFVMLNPSVADATKDDPTIRKCMGFAARWGATGIRVVNLFALVATKPRELMLWKPRPGGQVEHSDGWNLHAQRKAAEGALLVVAAWGAQPGTLGKHVAAHAWHYVRDLPHVPLWCLGRTQMGEPRHPLYMPYAATLTRWHE